MPTKRALCIGINKYTGHDRSLRGAVNDATSWAGLLTRRFGFARADVTLMLDEEATHARILSELDALLSGARPGDLRVFMIACHGTYLADEDRDDADLYDEAICPWDYQKALLIDDELRQRFTSMASGVHITVIADCCYSGTVTRRVTATASTRRPRFMPPDQLGRAVLNDVHRAHPRRSVPATESAMKELLLSACRSDQYAYDDNFGGTFRGVLSYYAIQLIEQAAGNITYASLLKALRGALGKAGYDQEPQLEGSAAGKRRKVFT